MRIVRLTGWKVVAMCVALVSTCATVGCESGGASEPAAATISPEMEKKTQEMLKNYGKQYNDMYRAKKQGPRG
jgi:hypothetical protein